MLEKAGGGRARRADIAGRQSFHEHALVVDFDATTGERGSTAARRWVGEGVVEGVGRSGRRADGVARACERLAQSSALNPASLDGRREADAGISNVARGNGVVRAQ